MLQLGNYSKELTVCVVPAGTDRDDISYHLGGAIITFEVDLRTAAEYLPDIASMFRQPRLFMVAW